jgi:hypothetical protein
MSVVLGTSLNSLHVQYMSATTCMLAIVSTLSWDFCQNISLWLSKELVHLICHPTELIIIGTNSLVVVQYNLPFINATMEGHLGWRMNFAVYPTIWQGRWLLIITKQCLSVLNTLPLHRIQSLITFKPGCKQTSWIFTCRSWNSKGDACVETSPQKHGSVALGLITHCLTITPWEELHLMFVVTLLCSTRWSSLILSWRVLSNTEKFWKKDDVIQRLIYSNSRSSLFHLSYEEGKFWMLCKLQHMGRHLNRWTDCATDWLGEKIKGESTVRFVIYLNYSQAVCEEA